MGIEDKKNYLIASPVTLAKLLDNHGLVGFVLWSDGSATIYVGYAPRLFLEVDKDTWEEFNLRYNLYSF